MSQSDDDKGYAAVGARTEVPRGGCLEHSRRTIEQSGFETLETPVFHPRLATERFVK